jgi:Type IV pilin-like G and H, putative
MGLVSLASMMFSGCAGQSPTVQPSSTLSSSSSEPAGSIGSVASSASLPNSSKSAASSSPSGQGSPKGAASTPSILGKLNKDFSSKVVIAKQDSGKTYLSNILLSQQAEKLVKGRFNPDLKRLSEDMPLETDEYRLEVRQADASQAVIVAIAKQPGFASYTGVAYAVEGKIPTTSICKTNVPSQTPPLPPKLEKVGLICGPGSSTVN